MKCLIVDDNAPVRAMIREVLKEGQMDFVECADGAEAPAVYAAERPDWVLMDIKMKNVDGLTATREITQAFPDARIIILTNYADPGLRDDAQRAGAFAFVLKENIQEVRSVMTRAGM